MGTKRRNRSEKRKDDVRFVVIKPKRSNRMKLPDRLFHPDRTGSVGNVRAKAPSLENHQPNLSLPNRFVAILLAAVWLCAGFAMIVLGVRHEKWILALLGPFGIWYGLAWVRVAHEGRLPGGRLRLNPWSKG